MTVIVFGNVGRGGNSAHAIEKLCSVKGRNISITFAEIDEADTANEKQLLLDKAKENDLRVTHKETRVPHAFRMKNWKLTDTERVQGHPGIEKISPPRLITINKYDHEKRDDKLAIVNLHTVAGAYNASIDGKEQLRKEYWEKIWEKLIRVTQRLHDNGYNVIITGDLNRQRPPIPVRQLSARARIIMNHTVDYMITVPAKGYAAMVTDKHEITLGIEKMHTGLVARVEFEYLLGE